jgi:hypothetical protein
MRRKNLNGHRNGSRSKLAVAELVRVLDLVERRNCHQFRYVREVERRNCHQFRYVHEVPPRRGTALIVVLVVIVLMTLAAYTFSELMIIERLAADRFGREAAARAFADSGVELAAAWIGTPADPGGIPENLYHNPALFGGVLVRDVEGDRSRGRVSLVAPDTAGAGGGLRAGLIDESSKLNLNALLSFDLDEEQQREMLMYLPQMTEDIADAVLDWIDDDDEPRTYGAESESYPDYPARNGPLESIDELLLVAGVMPELLYGEDANRNGMLDPNEDDGDLTAPFDNADGSLDAGWAAYLTVYSRESNLRSDGSAKIDLNQSLLTELYDLLEEEFDADIAKFITAYRLAGSTNIEVIETLSPDDDSLKLPAQEVAQSLFGGGGGTVTRNGLDLSAGASYTFYSIYDLIDAEVEVEINDEETTLTSPWTSDPGDLAENLPMLFDAFSLGDAEFIEGRLNVNQAPYELLLGLPEMPPELAALIADESLTAANGAMVTDVTRQTTGWLLINGLTDQLTLRKLDRYLTVRGSVYRAISVGHFDQGGPLVRVEAVIDGTLQPPRVVFQRDLTHLGPGYRIDQLSQLSAQ